MEIVGPVVPVVLNTALHTVMLIECLHPESGLMSNTQIFPPGRKMP